MMKPLTLSALLLASAHADTALTIYNQNLVVVRETLPLDLKAGVNTMNFDRATAQVMPDSVVLRDPAGKASFSILEQGYRNDPVSRPLLLNHFQGQTIDFLKDYADGKTGIISGKIIRSGYVPGGQHQDPIIEVKGKLRFRLPGEPLFPALGDDSILRPALGWEIRAKEAAKFDAQLSYLSRGFKWEADYNFVAPEKGETVTLTGWVTLENNSGTGFTDSKIKLVAGDVNITPVVLRRPSRGRMEKLNSLADASGVQEKSFDDFHLYTLPRPLTIRDRESKQVEFIRAPKVKAKKAYYYTPLVGYRFGGGRNNGNMQGQTFSKDVGIYWQLINDEASGLGMPLPAGQVRFYRSDDDDGNLEFVGENRINHTPRNEKLNIYTGNAFDLVGERIITDFKYDRDEEWIDETIEVTLKNRSKEPKTIIAREQLFRWSNWEIRKPTMKFNKKDADTIEFTVDLKPDETKTITYTAHYSW